MHFHHHYRHDLVDCGLGGSLTALCAAYATAAPSANSATAVATRAAAADALAIATAAIAISATITSASAAAIATVHDRKPHQRDLPKGATEQPAGRRSDAYTQRLSCAPNAP